MTNFLHGVIHFHLIIRNAIIRKKLNRVRRAYLACYWHNKDWAAYYKGSLNELSKDLEARANIYFRALQRIEAIRQNYFLKK